jgi:hypothetical protein
LERNDGSVRRTCRSERCALPAGPSSMRAAARALDTAPTGEVQSTTPRLHRRAPTVLPAALENVLKARALPPVGACTAADRAASLEWCSPAAAAAKPVRPRGDLAHLFCLPPLHLGEIANLVLLCMSVRGRSLHNQTSILSSCFSFFLFGDISGIVRKRTLILFFICTVSVAPSQLTTQASTKDSVLGKRIIG